jgi:hypothetical protein
MSLEVISDWDVCDRNVQRLVELLKRIKEAIPQNQPTFGNSQSRPNEFSVLEGVMVDMETKQIHSG